MKTITIGRDSSNQYVVYDNTNEVSRHQAILKIHDNNNVFIQDLGSANKTFVNGKEIPQHIDIPINWGDNVNFAEVDNLNWGKISAIVDVNITTYTIGSKAGNSIVLYDNSGGISRNHAVIEVHENGSIFLTDYSSNGTWVNGMKIQNTKTSINRGDNIRFANTQGLNWDNIIATKNARVSNTNWKWAGIPTIVVLLGILGYFGYAILFTKEMNIHEKYKNSVGLVYQEYYQIFTDKVTKDTLFILGEGQVINFKSEFLPVSAAFAESLDYDLINYSQHNTDIRPFISLGSSFLISKNGMFVTNRHVSSANKLSKEEQDLLENVIGVASSFTSFNYIQPEIRAVNKYIGFLPNERELDSKNIQKSLIEATVIKEALEPEIDLALVQLNTKKLPKGCTFIDIEKDVIKDKEAIKVGSNAVIFGFPAGLDLGLNGGENVLKASYNEGVISKVSNKYEVQYDIPSFSGASGSPVFDKTTGKLIAVNYLKMNATQGFNFGIIATHISKLLD